MLRMTIGPLLTLAPSVFAATLREQPPGYARVLIPIPVYDVASAYGSIWRIEKVTGARDRD